MKLTTVLFDFDGTLANTLPLAIYGMQVVFKKYDGRTFDAKGIVSMFGPPEDRMIANNFLHRENVPAAIEHYYRIYETEHRNMVEDHPEIRNLLYELKKRQIRVGLITGKSRHAYQLSEKALGYESFFESVITGSDVEIPKPDPSGIKATIKRFDADPESTIYIGDSNTDIIAGQAAGIHTAAVQWLPVSQSSEFPAGPDFLWTKVDQFLDLLNENE